jgi:acyl carrier protein
VRFRYDVILHVGGAPEIPHVPEWLDWKEDGLDITGLTGRLREGPATLAIRGVPNRRVIADVRLCELLKTHNGAESAAQLRDEAAKTSADAVDPEDLWNLGKTLGYRVDIGWPANNAPAFLEVVFTALGRAASPFVSSLADRRIPARSMHQFTNVPAQPVANSPLAPDLRRHAGAKLPDYMVPSLYIALEKLPLTPNGKIDRKALPAPSRARPRIAQALAEPETELQRSMVQLWQEVLQIDRIGIDDPFFEIGANSLHVAEVHLRLSKFAGRGLPITALFQFTTVRTLADHLSSTASPTTRATAVQDRASRQRQALFGRRPARD